MRLNLVFKSLYNISRRSSLLRFFAKFARSCRSSGLITTRTSVQIYAGGDLQLSALVKMPQTHSLRRARHTFETTGRPRRSFVFCGGEKNEPRRPKAQKTQ